MLAELGARVIKIEQEGSSGDTLQKAVAAPYWANKERMTLNLRAASGKRMLDALLSRWAVWDRPSPTPSPRAYAHTRGR